jgi:hypothetical protein
MVMPLLIFYSTSKDENFVIQGRALPFDDNDEVPWVIKRLL